MTHVLSRFDSLDFLAVVLVLQVTSYMIVFLDVPVARQIFGFLYFSFVPGYVIVKLLKLDELGRLEILLFSVGFSIGFLMVAGLLVNELCPIFGFQRPLATLPLIVITNSIVLFCSVVIGLRTEHAVSSNTLSLDLSPMTVLWIVLPVLSIVGAMCVNIYANNVVLLFTIVMIALLFSMSILLKKLKLLKIYPFAILMIAIAILFHSSLISNYLVGFGSDITGEFFAFKTTQNALHWSSVDPYLGGEWSAFGRLNSMLSVTLLPTVYSSLLNLDSTLIFKILFPLVFTLVPLGLWQLWQVNFGRKYAFIAAFLFMAQATFYTELLALARQMVAELFFVLLLLLILGKKINPAAKIVCFMFFSFGLIVSHYALAEIFLFMTSFALVYIMAMKRPRKNVTISMFLFFFAVMFLWYMYTSNSAVLTSLTQFGNRVYDQLGDFFNPGSRGETVLRGLGLEAAPSIWNLMSRFFAYLTEALIIVGFVSLFRKRQDHTLEYFLFTVFSVVLLAALVVVPGLANTLNMTRFYHTLLFFLAPLCVLGAHSIVNLIGKHQTELKASILLLIVLVPYFLFQTGFVYEVTKSESWSISLSKQRMDALRLYVDIGYYTSDSVFGAQWLADNTDVKNKQLYSDFSARGELRGYGQVYIGYIEMLSNITTLNPYGIVYLKPLNTIQGVISSENWLWNTTELYFLYDLNQVYTNGGSEIRLNQP